MTIARTAQAGVCLSLALTVGCRADQTMPGPGDALTGYWSNDDAHLDASTQAATFLMPCATAHFAPLVLDADEGFSATSTSYVQTGNVRQTPGAELRIDGTLSDGKLIMSVFVVQTFPVNDPLAVTLTPGGSHDAPVCTA
jgi:hypothetical protein